MTRRELLLLAAAVFIALAAAGATRALDSVWGRDEIRFGPGDPVAPTPARLDVNTAGEHELMMLPGVGPSTAARIVADREENGPFAQLDDLARVRGIGPATVEGLRPHAMCARPEGD